MGNKETIPFGTWIIINDDEFNQGQVVDYDILNDAYMIDRNGQWSWFDSKQVQVLKLTQQI